MSSPQVSSSQVAKLVNVIPVGLKEAALDSPSFRASTAHFFEQIDAVERWLDGYVKTAGRLSAEVSAIESVSSCLLSHLGAAPVNGSEAVLDHDYALLALKRYGDSAKDFWSGVISTLKEAENLVAEPVRGFLNGELRNFKELRRVFEQSQKQYDHLQMRFAGQGKSKEPSSLREDAFQLHEARKAYLKASMDFCVQSPHLKMTLEKLLVHVSYDQWREFRVIRNRSASTFDKFGAEMDRIRGWTHEIENSEQSSRKELLAARKQIEEAAELAVRPSRELEDYAISTVPYLGSQGPASLKMVDRPFGPEKQGWVSLRVFAGKPTRAVWVRRWAILRNGVFGCLVQGSRTGGVEESERIGVLLCSIRPAFQEERRFCFEVKTKSNSIMLQTETQKDLTEWIGTFESAKRKALETPQSEWSPPLGQKTQTQDPAFSITQPPAPEFTADPSESLTPNAGDEQSTPERAASSLSPGDGLGIRASGDIRRSTAVDRDTEGSRDHTSRIIHKLDIHRKSNAGSQHAPNSTPQPGAGSGAISNLISTSNLNLPMPGGSMLENDSKDGTKSPYASRGAGQFSLGPATLATPPMPTSTSRAAVVVSSDRGIGVGLSDNTGSVPSGMMANLWGSTHWGLINKLKRNKHILDSSDSANDPTQAPVLSQDAASSQSRARASHHRQTASLGGTLNALEENVSRQPEYPSYYPQQLKIHDAQFCLLFPDVPRDETLVFVFRATFSPNDQQEFSGRAFATTRHLYFYSNCSGLVLTSCVDLSSISEVTAAPGRDCDFLFLHIIPEPDSDTSSRVTVKTFLEPLRLLQKRLNFLVNNASQEQPAELEAVIKSLQKLEMDGPTRSPSIASFDDRSMPTPVDDTSKTGLASRSQEKPVQPSVYVDKNFSLDQNKPGRQPDTSKLKLPAQSVEYVPQGTPHLAAEKIFDINAKILFHVLFGDKSTVWQQLQLQRQVQDIKQGPWTNLQSGHKTRNFDYRAEVTNFFGNRQLTDVSDYQIVDVLNEHLCYVVTNKRTPWYLPFRRNFRLVSKIVITYVSKSKCKLAIFSKVEWLRSPYVFHVEAIIEHRALKDLEEDSLDLIDLAAEQVRKLGTQSQIKAAISMFGQLGRQTEVVKFGSDSSSLTSYRRRNAKSNGLLPLLLETSGSLLESAVSALVMGLWEVLRCTLKQVSANRLVVLILVSSLTFNSLYSYQLAGEMWNERKAGDFMHRLGVVPNGGLTKAVYIKDLDEAIAPVPEVKPENSSSCYSLFHENFSTTTDDIIPPSTSGARDFTTAKSAAYRFQRARQRLGAYRHDLLVALRLVNRVEKDVLQAEWERWVLQESRRCEMLGTLLKERTDESSDNRETGDASSNFKDFTGRADIEQWYQEYCLSCQREQRQVTNFK